jgi:hypothetical protein
MTIPEVSSNTNYYQTDSTKNNFRQIQSDFQQLGQALQSGDLKSAQQVFSGLQQLLLGLSGNQAPSGQQNSSQNKITDDMNALDQALKSDDLSKAQDAFTKLQQDMQAAQKKHHHHHHHNVDGSQNSVSGSNGSSGSSDVSRGDTQSTSSFNVIV